MYRALVFFLDLVLISFVIFFMVYVSEIIIKPKTDLDVISIWSLQNFIFYFGFLGLINKDITGCSFFKRIFGLQIISTGKHEFLSTNQLLISP